MDDLLRHGSDWLERTRTRHATAEVTYLRGASAVTVRATVGKTGFDQATEDGLTVRLQTRDYLINVDELSIDDIPAEPMAGDRILECDGQVFEVMPSAGEGPWRYSDLYRRVYRIHTKGIGPLPVP